MPSYMYILECADGSYYTGSTKDLDKRLWQHHNGEGANYTQKRLPVKLVYCEPYDRVEDAFNREKQVQGWSHRKKQALVTENYDKLIAFSRNYTEHGNPFECVKEDTNISLDPAAASTGSAYAYMMAGETLTPPPNKPLPEPVEGCGMQEERNQVQALPEPVAPFPEPVEGNTDVSLDPAMASTGSAAAYVLAGTTGSAAGGVVDKQE
jgi:putative endonuclease